MRAFIAMPFAQEFDPHWQVISDVCKDLSIDTYRVDKDLSYERHIDIAIRKEIEASDLVIAVLTGDSVKTLPNANVAYEVGYAHGIDKEAILLADSADCLPFDFQQQRTCIYGGNVQKMQTLLAKEAHLLKEKLAKEETDKLVNFFAKITRCLRIVLPPQYNVFREDRGFVGDELWYAVYMFRDKYFLRYTVGLGAKVNIYTWVQEYRADFKNFARKHYDDLRRYLGFDVVINFKDKGATKENMREMMRDINFIRETLSFDRLKYNTEEALQIALRLRDYIEALQPIAMDFINEKGLQETLLE